MSISIICSCKAKLEIDERFAGQTIQCPDCQKFLSVPGRPAPISLLAIGSLTLSLMAGWTVIGGVAAATCGFLALRSMADQRHHLRGRGLAISGIALGCLFSMLTVGALAFDLVFPRTGWLRGLPWAGRLEYDGPMLVQSSRGFSLLRPTLAWGVMRRQMDFPEGMRRDDVMLVDLNQDIYVTCLTSWLEGREQDWELCQQLALQKLRASEVLSILEKRDDPFLISACEGLKPLPSAKVTDRQECYVEVPLRGGERKFLLRIHKVESQFKMYVVAGGSRKSRFAGVESHIREVLDSFKVE